MTELLLIRHAVTEANLRYDFVGWSDPSLHDKGHLQAAATARALAREAFTAVVSSSSLRAIETADAICQFHPGAIRIHSPLLREIHMGEFDGLSSFAVYEQHPEIVDALLDEENTEAAWPKGEGYQAVLQRFGSGLQEILVEFPHEKICLVTHGGPIGIWMASVNQMPLSYFRRYQPAHASISRILCHGNPQQIEVISWNEQGHLLSE